MKHDHKNSSVCNQRGLSLIEIIISMAILGISAMAFANLLTSQQREMKFINERMAANEVQRVLATSLTRGKSCYHALNVPTPITFDTTSAFPITINLGTQAVPRSIHSYVSDDPTPVIGPVLIEVGGQPSVVSNSLVTKSLRLVIESGSGSTYIGNWIVDFDETRSVRALRPVTVGTALTVDASNPSAAVITGCSEAGASSGPTQQWVQVSRASGVAYQNTSPHPIGVKISATGFQTWAYLILQVSHDGSTWVQVDHVSCYDTGSVGATVPAGHYYRATLSGSMTGARAITSAAELR